MHTSLPLRALAVVFGLMLPLIVRAGDYVIHATHRLGGEGGWDYLSLDPGSGRLFIARGNRVQVVDSASGQLVGEIPDTQGVHGVALAADLGKGYTSNGRDASVTVFDLKTLRTLAKVATRGGDNPDFITYDSSSRRVFAFNGASHNASVIDATTDQVVAMIPLGGKPEAAAVDGRGRVFVEIEDRNTLTAIDSGGARVVADWPLSGCDEPAGLAIDTVGRRLFVGCHNRVMLVVNADNGAVLAQLPIGAGVDAAAFDTQLQLAFSSQGDGTLSIIKAEGGTGYRVQQTATTWPGARTMALNPRTHEVFLVTAEFDDAPAPSASQPRPRRPVKAGTFTLLVLAPKPN